MNPRIHIVDDHPGSAEAMAELLEDEGYTCAAFDDPTACLVAMRSHPPELLITDLRMDGLDGIELLRQGRLLDPELPVILVTAYGSIQRAVEATRLGAFAFVTKPVQPHDIVLQVRNALALRVLRAPPAASAGGIEGGSPGLLRALGIAERAANSDLSVLITGESGTGKELFARHLHRHSGRTGRFVAVNCGAIPESLLEAELFGHARGAFTGATSDRAGLVEEAHGGTFFLDEIGELTPAAQVRLLRFLQEGTFRRVGESRERSASVRVVAATHQALRGSSTFREDLYFRLAVVPIELPALRERGDDVLLLLGSAVNRACARTSRTPLRFTAAALEALRTYRWPGNVRELVNIAERLVLLSDAAVIDVGDLPAELQAGAATDGEQLPAGDFELTPYLEQQERRAIVRAMERHGNVQTRAAASLGLERNAFRYKLHKHGLLDG